MARDEAIRIELEDIYGILDEHHPNYTVCKPVAARNIDRYARLGMLKLDEPKAPWDKFKDVFVSEYDYLNDDTAPCTTLSDIKATLVRAGLKIAEA